MTLMDILSLIPQSSYRLAAALLICLLVLAVMADFAPDAPEDEE